MRQGEAGRWQHDRVWRGPLAGSQAFCLPVHSLVLKERHLRPVSAELKHMLLCQENEQGSRT